MRAQFVYDCNLIKDKEIPLVLLFLQKNTAKHYLDTTIFLFLKTSLAVVVTCIK
jgi:hypothetical protein